jgi:SMC interacting uncharacterized protein involved in chromosome segregation
LISANIEKLIEDHKKLQEEDDRLAADIKEVEARVDYHTVENREKRKQMQERRNALAGQMQALAGIVQQGQKTLMQVQTNVETTLELAKHAETWEWKEVGNSNTVHANDQSAGGARG